MRRAVWILLCLLLAVSLAACGRKEPEDTEDGSSGGESAYVEGELGEAMHTYWFDFTVNSAYACDAFGKYAAGEGNRLVVVNVSVENVCDFSVDMYLEDFQIEWDDENGGDYALALSAGTVDGEEQFPDEYTLKAGGSRDGVLVYEVPDGASLDYYLTFLEVFDDGTQEGQEGDVFVVLFTADAEGAAAAV